MTHPKTIKQIHKLLDAAESAKEPEDTISKLSLVNVFVEQELERLRKARDKKKLAYDARTRIIKKALKQFLTALDKISEKHEELGDTDVREQMYRAIYRGFIEKKRGYSLPERFGLFRNDGNALVRSALQNFLAHPEVKAASKALKTREDRFAAFQDVDVETTEGHTFFEYFGYSNRVRVA